MIDREFSLIARASTDELTSLANRGGFTEIATHVLALCKRSAQPAVAIGIDLDRFKYINDTLGHEAGDDALRLFSTLLFENFRSSDVVARIGGDEFAILCSCATAEQIGVALKRLRTEFEASTIVTKYPGLSWSAGLAEFDPATDACIDDLLRIADVRMYHEKAASKQRHWQERVARRLESAH